MKTNSYLAKSSLGFSLAFIILIFANSTIAKTTPKVESKNIVKLICEQFSDKSLALADHFDDARNDLQRQIERLQNTKGVSISNVSVSVTNPSVNSLPQDVNSKHTGKICASIIYSQTK
jgi:hypothetical protein